MSISRRMTTAFAVAFAASAQLGAQNAPQNAPQSATQTPEITAVDPSTAASMPSATTSPANASTDLNATAAAAPGDQGVSMLPTQDNATVGVRAKAFAPGAPAALPRSQGAGSNVAMMIVGGAALIVGAIVGGTPGTIIMIGGGVIGLIGLYRYLQ